MTTLTIWKYELPADPAITGIRVPRGAKFLSAQAQRGKLQVWALVNPREPEIVVRILKAVHTGGDAFDQSEAHRWQFVGTVQLEDGDYILHVFARIDP